VRSRRRGPQISSRRTNALAGAGGTGLTFVGNIEGTQVTDGVADVVVMDGFTGTSP